LRILIFFSFSHISLSFFLFLTIIFCHTFSNETFTSEF
jgi:hypothetical protein